MYGSWKIIKDLFFSWIKIHDPVSVLDNHPWSILVRWNFNHDHLCTNLINLIDHVCVLNIDSSSFLVLYMVIVNHLWPLLVSSKMILDPVSVMVELTWEFSDTWMIIHDTVMDLQNYPFSFLFREFLSKVMNFILWITILDNVLVMDKYSLPIWVPCVFI